MHRRGWLVALTLGLGCPSPTTDTKPAPSDQPEPAPAPEPEPEPESDEPDMSDVTAPEESRRAAAAGFNSFTFKLFAAAEEPGNVCLSPFSAAMALSLLHLGAREHTAASLRDALGLPLEKPHAVVGALLAQSSGGTGTEQYGEKIPPHELTVANSLWVAKNYDIESSYVERAVRYYDTQVADIDVTQPAVSAKRINDWTAEQTKDKIQDLVPESAIQPLTRLVIVNAVYLKAFWREPFMEDNTGPATFFAEGGKPIEVPTMNMTGHLSHSQDPDVDVLELGYWPAEGAELSMVFVLPKERDGLAKLEEGLTAERFEGWLSGLKTSFVQVSIPKFKIETSLSLRASLEKVGLGELFEGPDLGGISSEEGLHVDEVIQKTFIDVDEKGTEAAAATAIMLAGSGMPPEPIAFKADHPFLYVIRDKTTGAIVFIGRVADPS